MKKDYVTPTMVCEEFAANEYVAACGDSGTIYKFKCNAGERGQAYNVYLADGTPYATFGRDSGGCKTDYSSYQPCGEEHEAESDSIFLEGYMHQQNFLGSNVGSRIDVMIWTDNYTDVHCTTEFDMSRWETAKS